MFVKSHLIAKKLNGKHIFFLLLFFISTKYLKHMSISENFYAPNFFFFVRFNFWFFKFFTIFWNFWAKKACFSPKIFFSQKQIFIRKLTLYWKQWYITLMCLKFASDQRMRCKKGCFFAFGQNFWKKCLPLTAPLCAFFQKVNQRSQVQFFCSKWWKC